MIFETHAHYDDKAFDGDREELLSALPAKGVARVVNVGSSMEACRRTVELTERYDYIYGAIGIHPGDTAQLDEDSFARLRELCLSRKCVAVGEIGLDYYWQEPPRDMQKYWFRRQLRLAAELGLPVVIHSREAAGDTVEIMKEEDAGAVGGVVHCFSYTKETARAFLDMGFFIGIGGVLTFRNGKKLREALEVIPLERIVLETDSPYLAPEPYRGKRNSSLYLPYVARALAKEKGVSAAEAEEITYRNALRLFPKIGE